MLNLVPRLARCAARALAAIASAAVLVGPLAHAQAAQTQPKPAAPATRTADPDQSRIGPGDSVRISVYQSPDLSMETRVNETGDISYPLLGRVKLAGLTVTQAEQHIAAELKRREFVRDPQVQMVVTQVRANQVNVLGQVGRPGRYPLDLTGMRLTEVLALAGGIVAGVGSDTVVVTTTRDGKSIRREVDMPRLFQPGSGVEDIVITPGDTIFVDRAPQIYLYGEIQHPGAIRLERGMTVMQAIAAGGGATPRGTLRGLKVTRTGADGKQTQLEPAMDDQLKNGDVVYVKESLF